MCENWNEKSDVNFIIFQYYVLSGKPNFQARNSQKVNIQIFQIFSFHSQKCWNQLRNRYLLFQKCIATEFVFKKKGILGPVLKIRLVQKENSRRKSPEKNVQGLPDFCHTLYIIDVKREAPSFISTCFVSFSFASLSSSSYLQVLLRLLIILSVSK